MATPLKVIPTLDPRIEPQSGPVYTANIPPDQNQWYRIKADVTNSSITATNITTLGAKRAFLDTFELEITAEITFKTNAYYANNTVAPDRGLFMPQSFPFNSVCDQIQININGGSFFSNPSRTIRAVERYWNQAQLQDSYGNVCPCSKPLIQNEFGVAMPHNDASIAQGWQAFTRSRMLGRYPAYASSATGPQGSTNFSILPDYEPLGVAAEDFNKTQTITVTWREPIMCSPFSARYDATYGRPLYNITSIDMSFKMFGSLKNMFLCMANRSISEWDVKLTAVDICYQVLTVATPIAHDIVYVPYRRFVPYITNGSKQADATPATGKANDYHFTSGVYTLTDVPTAIWIYAAPQLSYYHDVIELGGPTPVGPNNMVGDRSIMTNKLFGFLKHISISCGNTTQILDTATPYDLYRIAKSNGCQDSYEDWARADPFEAYIDPHSITVGTSTTYTWKHGGGVNDVPPDKIPGCGSVLRLIPGVDIVLPERPLYPGGNANNLIFQVNDATYDFRYGTNPRGTNNAVPIALWVVFEYVGIAAFSPGHCNITMNPLGDNKITWGAAATEPIGTSSMMPASTTEGSGWTDTLKSVLSSMHGTIKDSRILSKLLEHIPTVGKPLASFASSLGYGDHPMGDDDDDDDDDEQRPLVSKRARSGGAVLGLGDLC